MPKLALIGTIEVVPGRRDQLLSALLAHRDRCLTAEPGTLHFDVLAPDGDDTKVLVYEVYRDAAACEAHLNGPSLARWRDETAGMIVKIYGTTCAVID